jgi:Schlafen, AlbA_2
VRNFGVPEPTEWQRIGDKIKAAFIFADGQVVLRLNQFAWRLFWSCLRTMAARLLPQGEITVDMLRTLIKSEIAEGQTIEFKRLIDITDENAKKKLSAEIASFANASGGDIVFGIDEKEGRASKLIPLPAFDPDKTELQLRQIFNSNIEPPVPGLQFCSVEVGPKKFALVLRIPRSWSRPHALVGEFPQFPVRDGNRRRTFTLRELREAFGLSASIAARMKEFRAERIASLVNDNAPAPLSSRTLFVLHVMPQSAFDTPQSVDLSFLMKDDTLIWAMRDTGPSKKLNFDGVLSYFPGDHLPVQSKAVRAYVQVFRDGCVEAVTTEIFHDDEVEQQPKIIFSSYEESVEKALRNHLNLLQKLEIDPPIFVSLAFIGAKDYSLLLPGKYGLDKSSSPIGRDVLIVPETPIYEYSSTYYDVLKESFDRVCQTCGELNSINYKDGKWCPAWARPS